ncbi:MAG: glutamine amidotransferase [Rhodobacterales bacterium]|nr:glutamine amidotransferase [Rhodobacterales bacterium]
MGTVLALRHVPFEDLGIFAGPLAERGLDVTYRAPWDGLDLDPAEPDLLVILGGPIGAYEEAAYPFLTDEIRLIEARLAAGKPILGICLGAQLMARALGARVYPGPAKEIGWAPLTLTEAGRASPLAALGDDDAMVLHWHGDTFDLPPGAVHLARTALVEHQAYAVGTAALGLQFHPEVPAAAIESWLVGHANEIAATTGVDPVTLRADTARHAAACAARGRRFLNAWLDGAGLTAGA